MTVGDIEETHKSSATALAADDAGLASVANIWSLSVQKHKAPVCSGFEIKPETDKIGLSPPRA